MNRKHDWRRALSRLLFSPPHRAASAARRRFRS
ncbi:hypothetical protein LHGZ1_3286 [Laribacter hongkongensis]|uniref:Uncharacterized protein n=1 Tax=Laribacter hongkongensis TaxID=168471 RepID=A0A248LMX6_9NEIS|nr:hypothetical protein LHGZ1_3286 [Laribacter hongkongensis]